MKNITSRTGWLPLAVLSATLAGALSASAVTVNYLGVSPYKLIGLTIDNPSLHIHQVYGAGSVYAGIYNLTVDGVATPSFCIDVLRHSGNGSDYSYDALLDSPLAWTGPMGAGAATKVQKLWGTYFSGISGNAMEAAAIQVAIWQTVAAGAGTYTVTLGNDLVSQQVQTRANQMLGNLTTSADLASLVSPTLQNYVVARSPSNPGGGASVPDGGSTSVLLGVGLLGLYMAPRLAKRSSRPATV